MAALQEGMADGIDGGCCPRVPPVVIDPQALARLRELDPGGQHGVVKRVLEAYQQSLSRHLEEMAAADSAGDVQRLMRSAHTLKSSSAAIGALHFSQQCADLEEALRSGGAAATSGRLAELIHEGRLVLKAVAAILAR